MKKRINLIFSITIIAEIFILGLTPVQAQSPDTLALSLSKVFGYGGFGGDIQGTFSLKAEGPENLTRVVFLLDGQPMGESSSAPFGLQFNTDSYPLGIHTLSAIGYTSDGKELPSNELRKEFVSGVEGGQAVMKIIVPILAIVVGGMLLSYVIPAVFGKNKLRTLPPGAPRTYGAAGGAICPNCGRPFSLNFLALNMVVGKFDRCPYCGKWHIQQRASQAALRAAEAAEIQQAQNGALPPETSEEEKLRKELDSSRYQDN